MTRLLYIVCLGLLPLIISGCSSCDSSYQPEPYPSFGQSLPGFGEPCPRDQCRPGLTCLRPSRVCDYLQCGYAPDSTAYCAQKYDVDPSKIECAVDRCVLTVDPRTLSCVNDGVGQCGSDGICVNRRCRQSCVNDLGCLTSEMCVRQACIERDTMEGCERANNPKSFCAQVLGLPNSVVFCANNECGAMLRKADESCVNNDECIDRLCEAGACTKACNRDEDCLPNWTCQPTADNARFACTKEAATCDLAEFNAVECSIRQGTPLSTSQCFNNMCRTLDDVSWPLLLIRDKTPSNVCENGYFGTTLTWIGQLNNGGNAVAPLNVEVLKAEIFHNNRFLNQASRFPSSTTYARSLKVCNDAGIQQSAYQSRGLLSLGCGGEIWFRFLRADNAKIVPLDVPTNQLVIGRHREYCQAVSFGTRFDQMDVYRCTSDVFDQGVEAACELLTGEENTANGFTKYSLFSPMMP